MLLLLLGSTPLRTRLDGSSFLMVCKADLPFAIGLVLVDLQVVTVAYLEFRLS